MSAFLNIDFEPHQITVQREASLHRLIHGITGINSAKLFEIDPTLLTNFEVIEDGSWVKRFRRAIYKFNGSKIEDRTAEYLGNQLANNSGRTLYYRFSTDMPSNTFDNGDRSCWRDYKHECNKARKIIFGKMGGLCLRFYYTWDDCVADSDDVMGEGRAFIVPAGRKGIYVFNIKTHGFKTIRWEQHILPILRLYTPADAKTWEGDLWMDIPGTYADGSWGYQLYSKKTPYQSTIRISKYEDHN